MNEAPQAATHGAPVRPWEDLARAVLVAWDIAPSELEHVSQGLINLTLKLSAGDGRRYVLQRLNPVFGDAVNDNLARVTAHLAARGVLTPRLVPTASGALEVATADGRWRLLTCIEGQAFDHLAGPAQAAAAGALLARFHTALADFHGPLETGRPPIHDFARHRAHLAARLAARREHRLHAAVRAASEELAALVRESPPATPARVVHGDPKISNLLFDSAGREALCLVDLDTLTRMPLALELGDALRSWCNPWGEDAPGARCDLALFAAAVGGYLGEAGAAVDAAERAGILPATLQICLELAARFLADALDETYFGWDARRYPARGEHNLARARGQLAVAASLLEEFSRAATIVHEAGGRGGP